MKNDKLFWELSGVAVGLGAYKANAIETNKIVLDRAFRDICATNACGMYGKCYMCPPDVGDIDELMRKVLNYDYALVYQTVTELEDSFDFEGMIEAKKKSYPLAQSLRKVFADMSITKALHLGAGGCGVCETCAKRTNEPCRFPEKAMPSLEAYGVNVSELARAARMKYINGQNTVTYFGAVLFSTDGKITATVNGKTVLADKGATLSEIIKGEKPCGGHGRCGKCKVAAKGELSELTEAEKKLLNKDELESGVRLSCLTYALGDCEVTTNYHNEKSQIVTNGALPEIEIKPTFKKHGIAIDIGTTTLAARLYDTKGNLLAQSSRINPQQEWGADVISRIEAALDGKSHELAKAIRQALDDIISELGNIANIDKKEIDDVVITGNTVMLSLLTEQSVEPFSHAPFDVKRLFGETLMARELELSNLIPNTPIYLPPCISAFVGADTTCAILATQLCEGETAMMADIGTNGEMALWHNGKLTVCSTAAGPAFEGVGISMGMRGADGAIDKVSIENGQLKAHVIGDGTPSGICGSGLVDAVACMLDLGIVDEGGYLEDDEFIIQTPVYLTPKDIRMLQLAKSAICAGLVTLIETEKLNTEDISTLYIAGGFGNYLNKESAAKIGLLPRELAKNAKAVGNAALAGASMLLLNTEIKAKAAELAKNAKTIDLSANPTFSEQYTSGMMLEEM